MGCLPPKSVRTSVHTESVPMSQRRRAPTGIHPLSAETWLGMEFRTESSSMKSTLGLRAHSTRAGSTVTFACMRRSAPGHSTSAKNSRGERTRRRVPQESQDLWLVAQKQPGGRDLEASRITNLRAGGFTSPATPRNVGKERQHRGKRGHFGGWFGRVCAVPHRAEAIGHRELTAASRPMLRQWQKQG